MRLQAGKEVASALAAAVRQTRSCLTWLSEQFKDIFSHKLEMANYLPQEKAAYYVSAAKRMMKALVDLCAVKSPDVSNGHFFAAFTAERHRTTTALTMGLMSATCGEIITMWKH